MRENTQRSIFVGGAERVTLPNPFKLHSKSGEKPCIILLLYLNRDAKVARKDFVSKSTRETRHVFLILSL